MVALIRKFQLKRVLDFSAGRGSRLVAALATDIEYTGIDPDQSLHPAYQKIVETLPSAGKCRLICGKAQDYEIDIGQDYDAVVTSPPYFNLEHYSNDPVQSTVEFPTLEQWLFGFLYPAIHRAAAALRKGGILCLNINDPGLRVANRQPFTDRVLVYVGKLGLEYLGCIGCAERIDGPAQPIWIWRK